MTFMIRELARAELPLCQDLAESRDWGREDAKWDLLFAVGTVYGIPAPDGDGLAAMAVGTRYGTTATAVSMVVTAARYERRGLGGRLMRHIMDTSGTDSHVLTATPYGRPLYERLGFRSIAPITAHFGSPSFTETGLSRPATPADLPAIIALDTAATGTPRTALLTTLFESHALTFRVVDAPDGTLLGSAGAWRYENHTLLGPLSADRPETAITLLTDLIATTPAPYRVEIGAWQPELLTWSSTHSLLPSFSCDLMEQGPAIPSTPTHLFTTAALAFG
ncbi:GNAT family N-acetyltransferase [Actinocorallia lasiicapitis]